MPLVNPGSTRRPVQSVPLRPGTPQDLNLPPADVQISAPQYQGVTVDTTLVPVAQLLTHVEGARWTVCYFSQVLDKDSPLLGQGLATPAVVQQYRRINGMELRVTQPLVASQDNDQKTMTYTGTATMYPFVIPNKGDIFLADIGAGREGIFEVTNSQRLSIYKQACHSIEYQMVDYSTPERRNDLNAKTIQTLEFVRDFIIYGQNPLLVEEDYTHLQSLRRNFKLLVQQYFDSFFSKEYSTIILPQESVIYDPYLTAALLRCFTMDDNEKITKIRHLSVQEDDALKAVSVWDAILDRNPLALLNAFTQYGNVYAYEFSGDAVQEGIRFSGIHELIYPVDALLTVDFNQRPPPKLVNGNVLTLTPPKMTAANLVSPPKYSWLDDSLPDVYTGFTATDKTTGNPVPSASSIVVPPPINMAMKDGYYVFSRAFYENDLTPGKQSQLELMVRQYLNGKALSYKSLDLLLESVHTSGLWNTMNKFYYIPVLLMLIRATIRSF